MRIAFLGLGNMGSGMAGRLQQAGYHLLVWNRTASKAAELAGLGATVCSSAVEAASQAEIVISSLMDDASVHAVFDGDGGVARAMRPGAVHLCVTTISPECADWLAATHAREGCLYVSGPVLGRPDAAAAGQLVQFLAGDTKGVEIVQPVCAVFAPTAVLMQGSARLANLQKLCANFFMAGMLELMAECLTFAEATGASRTIMAQIMSQSFANSGLKGYVQRMSVCDSDGVQGFSLRGGLKDIRLIRDAARSAGCPLDLANLIEEKMRKGLTLGLGDADWSVIQTVTRLRAGLSESNHSEVTVGGAERTASLISR